MIKKWASLISAFIVGIGVMLKVHLNNTGNLCYLGHHRCNLFRRYKGAWCQRAWDIVLVGQVFLKGLQLSIIPLVFTSLALAMSSITDLKKLGRIAFKTVFTFMGLYVCAAVISGGVGMFAVQTGDFPIRSRFNRRKCFRCAVVETANPLAHHFSVCTGKCSFCIQQ